MNIADDGSTAKSLMPRPQATTIECERTGSTSSACASGNLPVVSFSCDVPSFKTNAQILSELAAKGYAGTDKPESIYVLEHVTYQHLTPYLKALDGMNRHPGPSLKLAHDLLTFDRRMQAMLLKYTGVFEFQLRSQSEAPMSADASNGPNAESVFHLLRRPSAAERVSINKSFKTDIETRTPVCNYATMGTHRSLRAVGLREEGAWNIVICAACTHAS